MIYRTDDQSKNCDSKNKKHNGKRYKGKESFILNYKNSTPALTSFFQETIKEVV